MSSSNSGSSAVAGVALFTTIALSLRYLALKQDHDDVIDAASKPKPPKAPPSRASPARAPPARAPSTPAAPRITIPVTPSLSRARKSLKSDITRTADADAERVRFKLRESRERVSALEKQLHTSEQARNKLEKEVHATVTRVQDEARNAAEAHLEGVRSEVSVQLSDLRITYEDRVAEAEERVELLKKTHLEELETSARRESLLETKFVKLKSDLRTAANLDLGILASVLVLIYAI